MKSLNIYTIKKAVVLLNFCLIRKFHHNFPVPRMIELAFHASSDLSSTQSGLGSVERTFDKVEKLHKSLLRSALQWDQNQA